ncbi:ABC transporter permease [Candidatus Pacearchaeota archaeon]|nr:ABC transporter permease [Candidatus Pacearchaeota archaeon]
MISDYFRMSLRNVRREKARSFLTLLGISISIATIFVLISLSLGLEVAIQEQFETLGADKFFIQPRGQFGPHGSATAVDLNEEDIQTIERVQGVEDTVGWTVANAKIEFKDTIKFVSVSGIDPEKIEVAFGSYDLDEGRFLKNSGSKEIVVGSQYKYNNFLIEKVEIGDKILINDVEFEVVGIFETIGNPQDDRQIYLAEDSFRELFNIPNRVDFIIVKVTNQEEINEVADRVERRLMNSRDVDEKTIDFTILTPEELLGAVGNVLDIVTTFLLGVAAISLLVGGINIANTMFTSVLERTREIGVMKAIGAKNSDILSIFVIEAGFLGLIGGILGVLFGLGVGKAIEYVAINQLGTTLLKVVFPYYLILGCLAFAFLAGALSGLWPAWRATKIKPVEALRYE